MACSSDLSEMAAVEHWPDTIAELLRRIAHRFRRAQVRDRIGRYLLRLLDRAECKNGWQLAGPKEWAEIDGGHFGPLYFPSDEFERAAAVQTRFLSEHLVAQRQDPTAAPVGLSCSDHKSRP